MPLPVQNVPPLSTPVATAFRLAAPQDLAALAATPGDGTVVWLQTDAQGNLRVATPFRELVELRKIFLALCDGLTLDAESIRVRAIAGVADDMLLETPAATIQGNPSAQPT